jgi:protein-L-isoaspartate(D-aspartate) O-methyltransferase
MKKIISNKGIDNYITIYMKRYKPFLFQVTLFLLSSSLFISSCGQGTVQKKESPVTSVSTDIKDDRKIPDPPDKKEDQPVFDITQRREKPPLTSKKAYINWMLKNTDQEEPFLSQHWDRAARAIANKDLRTEKALIAFLLTPREYFCRTKNKQHAYEHKFLDIGYGQTISGPHCVARMTSELDVNPEHKVLEIGTGSGYQAAILAELSNWVYSIEIIEPLAKATDEIYKKLEDKYPEYKNVHRKIADGYYGWQEYAPFDRIIVTCGIDHIPPPLLQQLKPDGIMLIPVGPPYQQHVLKIIKHVDKQGKATYDKSDIYNGRIVSFVDFTAADRNRHSIKKDKPE